MQPGVQSVEVVRFYQPRIEFQKRLNPAVDWLYLPSYRQRCDSDYSQTVQKVFLPCIMIYRLSNSKFFPEVIPQRIQPDFRTSTELGSHPVSNPAQSMRAQSVSTAVGSKEPYQRIF